MLKTLRRLSRWLACGVLCASPASGQVRVLWQRPACQLMRPGWDGPAIKLPRVAWHAVNVAVPLVSARIAGKWNSTVALGVGAHAVGVGLGFYPFNPRDWVAHAVQSSAPLVDNRWKLLAYVGAYAATECWSSP